MNACASAQEFVASMDRSAFLDDRKSQSAVLHQLVIIGEATKRLSEEFRNRHAQIPWREIAGLRDRLVHAYDRVDLDRVWIVLERRLPVLRTFLEDRLRGPSSVNDD